MEYVACNLCGSVGNYAVLSEKGKFGLNIRNVICKKCGLVYQNPRPTAETLQLEYTSSNYHARYKGVKSPNSTRAKTEYYHCNYYVDFLSKYCDLSNCGTVLDVGCSTGGLLRRMTELGWKALGIEPSHNYAEFAKTVYGLEVIEGLLENTELPHSTFDVIITTHLLEHLYNPLDSLRQLHSSLKDNGLLLISTPNVLKPSGWYYDLFHDVHLFLFSPNTLRMMLSIAGFSPVDYRCQNGQVDMIAKKGIPYTTLSPYLPVDDWKAVRRRLWWYHRLNWLFVFLQKVRKSN
jgi:2-polyprenyl-3-methyl-5-hydroxy-6-metoxy-1,4-benzoquinol methylase